MREDERTSFTSSRRNRINASREKVDSKGNDVVRVSASQRVS